MIFQQKSTCIYCTLDFYCLCSLQKSSRIKNQVHQSRYFKLDMSKIKCRQIRGQAAAAVTNTDTNKVCRQKVRQGLTRALTWNDSLQLTLLGIMSAYIVVNGQKTTTKVEQRVSKLSLDCTQWSHSLFGVVAF